MTSAEARPSARRQPAQECPPGMARTFHDEGEMETGNLVRLAGIEPTTLGFGGQYSIH